MNVHVVSIHDRAPGGRVLAFDLREVLEALRPFLATQRFIIFDLDVTGPRADEIDEMIRRAGPLGLLVSHEQLVEIAAGIDQTIDGEVAGYPANLDPMTLGSRDRQIADFPTNAMTLAIVAVDSSSFEVYCKDQAVAQALERTFRDTRREDPASYF